MPAAPIYIPQALTPAAREPIIVTDPVLTGQTKGDMLKLWLLEDSNRLKLSGSKLISESKIDISVTQANVIKREVRDQLGLT